MIYVAPLDHTRFRGYQAMDADRFERLKACRSRILTVLGEGPKTRTALVRRCTAYKASVFRETLGMLLDGGAASVRLERHGRRATSVIALSERPQPVHDPLLVRMSEEAAVEQAVCVERLNGWLRAIEADRTSTPTNSAAYPALTGARDMLVMLHLTPWKYVVEAPLWSLTGDIADKYGDTPAKKAARKLADLGAILLKERRGRGRTSTFSLAHVPPWPMS
jgi:hypothetical protein